MSSSKCCPNLSLINLNIIKSPIRAPKAPERAVNNNEFDCAISPNVTIAGAVVKMEVKKIPATKLPRNLILKVESKILDNTSAFNITKAPRILKAIIAISCNKKLDSLFRCLTINTIQNPKVLSCPLSYFLGFLFFFSMCFSFSHNIILSYGVSQE